MAESDTADKLKQIFAKYPLPPAGADLDLVLVNGPHEQNVMLKSRLWARHKGYVLLLQTNPPLAPSGAEQELRVSYLLPFEQEPERTIDTRKMRRVGFRSTVRSIVELPSTGEQLILMVEPKRITPMSLRKLLRVTPLPEIQLNASLQLEGLSMPMQKVEDISVGGAKLLHRGGLPLSQGQRLILSLSWGRDTLLLPAMLLRHQDDDSSGTPQAALVVRFADLSAPLEQQLKQLLNRLWKQQRLHALTQAAQNMLAADADSFFS
jgi:hypothetical protein